MATKSRYKLWAVLVLLLLACLIPIILANWVYRHSRDLHLSFKHHGVFLDPVGVQLIDGRVKGRLQKLAHWQNKWLVVYDSIDCCHKACQNTLHQLQQMRIALHNGWERTQLLVLLPAACPIPANVGKSWSMMRQTKRQRQAWKSKVPLAKEKARIVIVDPKSRAVMQYQWRSTPRPIYEDMRVLLKSSQIG